MSDDELKYYIDRPEELRAKLEGEIRLSIAYSYELYEHLRLSFLHLRFTGHETPFERIGEILNEFETMIDYLVPEQYKPNRSIYQGLIDAQLEYQSKFCPDGIINYHP